MQYSRSLQQNKRKYSSPPLIDPSHQQIMSDFRYNSKILLARPPPSYEATLQKEWPDKKGTTVAAFIT